MAVIASAAQRSLGAQDYMCNESMCKLTCSLPMKDARSCCFRNIFESQNVVLCRIKAE